MDHSKYMYCPHCGQQVLRAYNFCPFCNSKLHGGVNSTSQTSQRSYQNRRSMNYYNRHVTKHSLYHYGSKYRIKSRQYTFSEAFTSFWKHYFTFSGYCSRSEFWWWFLFEYAVDIVLYLLYRIMAPEDPSIFGLIFHPSLISQVISDLPEYFLFSFISLIWNLAIFLPDLSIRIRRLRDVGLTEEWRVALLAIDYFPAVVPIIGYFTMWIARIVTIVFACKPSVRYKHSQKAQTIDTPPL